MAVIFRIYETMRSRGITTLKALSEATGIHETRIGTIVRGDVRRIDIDTLDRLCEGLGCKPGDLFDWVPNRPVPESIKDRVIGQLVGLTVAGVPGADRYREDPEVRRAAEEFFARHIERDLARGGRFAHWHAMLMRRMKSFVERYGAERGEATVVSEEQIDQAAAGLAQEIVAQ